MNTFKSKSLPNPSSDDIEDDVFIEIWETIKDWDINIPDYYNGYCGANGSHVMLILNKLREKNLILNRKRKLAKILKNLS